MTRDRRFQDAAIAAEKAPKKDIARPIAKAVREQVIQESSARYKDFVSSLNRTRDNEIEKAHRRSI